jgi:hypothetical protein
MEREIGGGGEEQSPGLMSQGQWVKREEEEVPVIQRVATFPGSFTRGHRTFHNNNNKHLRPFLLFRILIVERPRRVSYCKSSLDYVCSWLRALMTSFESEVAQS